MEACASSGGDGEGTPPLRRASRRGFERAAKFLLVTPGRCHGLLTYAPLALQSGDSFSMNIHTFEHAPFEGLGEIEPWIHAGGHRLGRTRFYGNDPLPEPDSVDWLIVMGGPMNVYEYRN
jgi:hypothetical protein